MNIEMVPLEIVGLKKDLQPILHILRRLGCVHIEEISDVVEVSARPLTLDHETVRQQEELNLLLARLEGILDVIGCNRIQETSPAPQNCQIEARIIVEKLAPKVQELMAQQEKLQAEQSSLPRYEVTLRKLLPLIPLSAHEPGYDSVGVLVSRAHVGVLDTIGKLVLEMTGGRAEIVASEVDKNTHAMLIVFPREFTGQVETLLGQEDISRLRLPARLGQGPPDAILAQLQRRKAAIPDELIAIRQELESLADQWCAALFASREALRDEVDMNRVLACFGETDMTFVMVGWVPGKYFNLVKAALEKEIGEAVMVQKLLLTPDMKKRAPILLQNPKAAKPFESLVSLLGLPRYGHIDPTRLMAFFLPIFFGMILGDVGYGALLLILSLALMGKFKKGISHDVVILVAMGSAWSIFFGFLFGEVFGTLGDQFGLRPLWFDRANPQNVAGLLLMTLAVGAVHITLGLILGVWEAYKDRSRNHLLERGGMLVGLISLFFLTAVLARVLPVDFKSPAIFGLILGIVLLGASLGWLGILMGPIEFIGLIGNILSYLRIAAIGLASLYLAKVANEMAGLVGNLIVGTIIALLIHALNLVLGVFSPTIHSLRLHYVEFFRKFYESGGRSYEPFKSYLDHGGE